jgi:hypothetical protein
MRTYGRLGGNPNGVGGTWTVVETDANGFNDNIYITTLCQTLLLNRGESPTFSNYGIPAQQSVIQQIPPDYFVAQTQQQFSSFFAALTIQRVSQPLQTPYYSARAVCYGGAILEAQVPI